MERYIRFIGIDNYKKIPDNIKAKIRDNVFSSPEDQLLSLELLCYYSTVIQGISDVARRYSLQGNKAIEAERKLLIESLNMVDEFRYQAPIIYSNTLLGLGYYCIDYAREINERRENPIFKYYDIKDIEGLNARVVDENGNVCEDEQLIEEVQPKVKLNNKINATRKRLDNLEKKRQAQLKTKQGLENPKNKNPRKQEILASIEGFLREYEQSKNMILGEINSLQEEIESCDDNTHIDSSNLFRHLRNSMAHGNYTISYGNFKDFNSIKYHFEDYDKETRTTFLVDMTAGKLEKILCSFQEKVNESVRNTSRSKSISNTILAEALRNQNIDKQDLDREEDIEKQITQGKGENDGKNI